MVAPRPASIRSFWSPASISVLGPKRSGLGIGVPVPSRVTLKSHWLVIMHFDSRFLDDLSPTCDFGFHERAVLGRRAASWFGAEIGERSADFGRGKCLVYGLVQPRNDIVRRSALHGKADPTLHRQLRESLFDDR